MPLRSPVAGSTLFIDLPEYHIKRAGKSLGILLTMVGHHPAHCDSNRSLTGSRHPGTAGSASAMSPRWKITGCSGSLAL